MNLQISKNSKILAIVALSVLALYVFSPMTTSAQALVAECDPSITDLQDPNACGLQKFLETVSNIIRWLQLIIIPLAFVFIGVGGFTILTSGGSAERVNKGRGMMMIAITGVIIMLLSGVAIRFLFQALEIDDDFQPQFIDPSVTPTS